MTTLDPSRWDARDASFRHDPIPWYRVLREQSPIHYHPEVGFVLSRYADVERLLRDERFGVATPSPWRDRQRVWVVRELYNEDLAAPLLC